MAARFVDVSESEIDQFKENAVPQKTKEATNHQCNSTKRISHLRRREYRRRRLIVKYLLFIGIALGCLPLSCEVLDDH